MMSDVKGDTLKSADIVPVQCPQCSEAQNTIDGILTDTFDTANIGCMVCGYQFDPVEYRRLLAERQLDFASLQLRDM